MKIDPAYAASIALDLYPESIRKDVLEKTSLASDLKVPMATYIGVGGGVEFERRHFNDAIRSALSAPPKEYSFQDLKGATWVSSQETQQSEAYVVLTNGERRIIVNGFSPFNPNADIRIKQFEVAIREVRMPINEYHYWLERIKAGTLDDESAADLNERIFGSPGAVELELVRTIDSNSTNISNLIPGNKEYYEALVGVPIVGLSFHEYVKEVLRPHFSDLLRMYGAEGLKGILSSCWHRDVTAAIDLSILSWEEVTQAIHWAAREGDMVSKHGAVELSIPILPSLVDIDSSIIQMIEEIRQGGDGDGELAELADVIRLVDGELARTALTPQVAPYWRRLASFTHAAVLHRSMKIAGVNGKNLAETNCYGRVHPFLMQSMIDMRSEPRWQPSYLSPGQLKAEFLGRILHIADQFKDSLPPAVYAYLYGDRPLRESLQIPDIFIPGPLEGAEDGPLTQLPPELEASVEIRAENGRVELASFIPLINCAMIFKLNAEKAELASEAIRTAKFQIRTAGITEEILPLLMGLASLATTTRNVTLTEDVLKMVRNIRYRNPSLIGVVQAWWIGMTAAASHSEEDSWCEFVGTWTLEVAYQDMAVNEAKTIRESMIQLCKIMPKLWLKSGRAIACLDSLAN